VTDGSLPGQPRRQISKGGFPTERKAEEAMEEVHVALRGGTLSAPSKLTLGVYLLDRWLPDIKHRLRSSTLTSYRSAISNYVVPHLGGVRLQALTPDHLNRFYGQMLTEGRLKTEGGLRPKTVRNIHVILHTALRDAVRWNYVPKNAAQFADPPRQEEVEFTTWTPEELNHFLLFAQDHWLATAWFLAASTGMRRGEVLGLRWQDTDLDRKRLGVRKTIISVDYKIESSEPKTKRGKRSIALDSETIERLKEHRASQDQLKLTMREVYTDEGLVFCRGDGLPIHPDRFTQMFDKLVKESGLPRIRLHDLRHTHATIALEAGIHPKVVSDRIGHATTAFTMDIYSHSVPAMEAEAAETIASLVRGHPEAAPD